LPAVTRVPAGQCNTASCAWPGGGSPGCQGTRATSLPSRVARACNTSRSPSTTSGAPGNACGNCRTRSGPMPAGSPQVTATGASCSEPDIDIGFRTDFLEPVLQLFRITALMQCLACLQATKLLAHVGVALFIDAQEVPAILGFEN